MEYIFICIYILDLKLIKNLQLQLHIARFKIVAMNVQVDRHLFQCTVTFCSSRIFRKYLSVYRSWLAQTIIRCRSYSSLRTGIEFTARFKWPQKRISRKCRSGDFSGQIVEPLSNIQYWLKMWFKWFLRKNMISFVLVVNFLKILVTFVLEKLNRL